MSTITSYKDLVVWRKSMELVADFYRLTLKLPQDERRGVRPKCARPLFRFHQISPNDTVGKRQGRTVTIFPSPEVPYWNWKRSFSCVKKLVI